MEQIQKIPRRAEYAIAFRSIRAAKNLSAMLIILCILVQIGATLAVHFARVLDGPTVAATPTPRTLPATATDAEPATQPGDSDVEFAAISRVLLEYGLPGSRFAALVLCLLLVLMVMFAVKLSLVERIGGIAGFMSAFNWSLILLMMLVPWKPILSGGLSCGALFSFTELMNANTALGESPAQTDQVLFYARFIAYPCAAMFTCLLVQMKFAKGFSAADFHLDEGRQDVAPVAPIAPPTSQMFM